MRDVDDIMDERNKEVKMLLELTIQRKSERGFIYKGYRRVPQGWA